MWVAGGWQTAGWVVLSTVLIYVSTVVGLRLGERRTLGEMSIFDFTVAVAVGGIVGRTATTESPSYVQAMTAVVVLLICHRLVAVARVRWVAVRRLVDRGPRVLVRDGRCDREAVRRALLTDGDLWRVMREHGVGRVADVRLLVLESRGAFSVIAQDTQLDPAGVPGDGQAGMMTSADEPTGGSAYLPVLREYAVIADGWRGAVIGPGGEHVWLCFPQWHDPAVSAALIGSHGSYTVRPRDRFTWAAFTRTAR